MKKLSTIQACAFAALCGVSVTAFGSDEKSAAPVTSTDVASTPPTKSSNTLYSRVVAAAGRNGFEKAQNTATAAYFCSTIYTMSRGKLPFVTRVALALVNAFGWSGARTSVENFFGKSKLAKAVVYTIDVLLVDQLFAGVAGVAARYAPSKPETRRGLFGYCGHTAREFVGEWWCSRRAALTDLEQQLKRVNAAKERLEKTLKAVETECEGEKAAKEDVARLCTDAQNQIVDLESRITQMQNGFADKTKALESEKAALQSQCDELACQLAERMNEIGGLSNVLKRSESINTSFFSDFSDIF